MLEEPQAAGEDGSPPPGAPNPPPGKKIVPGIIYLGHIPPGFRARHARNLLSVYGEVGRIFLQPEERFVQKRKKKAGARVKNYTEGWVEFRDKRMAKLVAASLHNTPISTRRRSRFRYDLWNMKYLHRFKWPHLSERLAYERQVRQQRLRVEISQAKRETNFYLHSVETSQRFARRAAAAPAPAEEKSWGFVQRPTEEEIQQRKPSLGVSDTRVARHNARRSNCNDSMNCSQAGVGNNRCSLLPNLIEGSDQQACGCGFPTLGSLRRKPGAG